MTIAQLSVLLIFLRVMPRAVNIENSVSFNVIWQNSINASRTVNAHGKLNLFRYKTLNHYIWCKLTCGLQSYKQIYWTVILDKTGPPTFVKIGLCDYVPEDTLTLSGIVCSINFEHLQSPPERMQSHRNYFSFLWKRYPHDTIL